MQAGQAIGVALAVLVEVLLAALPDHAHELFQGRLQLARVLDTQFSHPIIIAEALRNVVGVTPSADTSCIRLIWPLRAMMFSRSQSKGPWILPRMRT